MRGKETCFTHGPEANEQRKRATQASAEARHKRKEARVLSARDAVSAALEENAQALISSVVEAGKTDWRAVAWLYDRVMGKPKEDISLGVEDKRTDAQTRAELEAWLAQHLPEK
jgi:hypothetical protein